mmetsp:Transcript_107/g.141  ORF Transcript_107/g.141 Transcript_107/m.141 type:complete len:87 (-) Transcript_107:192-452(-)
MMIQNIFMTLPMDTSKKAQFGTVHNDARPILCCRLDCAQHCPDSRSLRTSHMEECASIGCQNALYQKDYQADFAEAVAELEDYDML